MTFHSQSLDNANEQKSILDIIFLSASAFLVLENSPFFFIDVIIQL